MLCCCCLLGYERYGLLCSGKRGCLLRTPKLLGSESHNHIEEELRAVLEPRRRAFGESGCPVAVATDNILRDHRMLLRVLRELFPAAMSRPESSALLTQDIIHRQWHFTRILRKDHADSGLCAADIKAIFGRFT